MRKKQSRDWIGTTRKEIFDRYQIKRWNERAILAEIAGVKGRWQWPPAKQKLSDIEAKRLIKACAEFKGSRHMGGRPSDDIATYGMPIIRRKRPSRPRAK